MTRFYLQIPPSRFLVIGVFQSSSKSLIFIKLTLGAHDSNIEESTHISHFPPSLVDANLVRVPTRMFSLLDTCSISNLLDVFLVMISLDDCLKTNCESVHILTIESSQCLTQKHLNLTYAKKKEKKGSRVEVSIGRVKTNSPP